MSEGRKDVEMFYTSTDLPDLFVVEGAISAVRARYNSDGHREWQAQIDGIWQDIDANHPCVRLVSL